MSAAAAREKHSPQPPRQAVMAVLEITVRNIPNTTPMAWEIRLGNTVFPSVAAMKDHILTLPKGTRLAIQNECCKIPGRPLLGERSELKDFESWCKNNSIDFKIRPSG